MRTLDEQIDEVEREIAELRERLDSLRSEEADLMSRWKGRCRQAQQLRAKRDERGPCVEVVWDEWAGDTHTAQYAYVRHSKGWKSVWLRKAGTGAAPVMFTRTSSDAREGRFEERGSERYVSREAIDDLRAQVGE